MCGIAGELAFDGGAASSDRVRAMADALRHRGPDDEGVASSGPVGLGHRRLSIIDLSPSGHQPMTTPDGRYVLIFNGEIYNHDELRADLATHRWRFVGRSDSEVLLAAFATWGIEATLARLIGMFAFAIWDATEQVLWLARDRAGVKPLHYFRDEKRLLFASELKGLVAHPSFPRRVAPSAVAQFLSIGYIVAPRTIYEQTFKLPAAHYVRVSADGAMSLHRYWDLDRIQRGTFRGSLDDAEAELEQVAASAFRYRLVSDVPVAVFLSGGVDSTYLAGVLKRRIGADLLHLTIGFKDASFDESDKAREVARTLGVRHEVRYLDADQAQGWLRRFVEVYDEPFGDTSGLPTLMVSALAREHVKVVLSADGGDEQFCGYPSYAEYSQRYESVRALPGLARRVLSGAAGSWPVSSAVALAARGHEAGHRPQLVARYEKGVDLLRVPSARALVQLMHEKAWPASRLPSLLADHGAVDPAAGTPIEFVHPDLRGADLVDAMMRTDYRMFLADDVLVKVDRASMAVSLECRDPFLDHRIAEFAYSLPLEYVFAGGEHKRLLKQALRRWLPESIVSAPKRGFMIPLYRWLRGPWRPLVAEYLSPQRVRAVGLLDADAVAGAVRTFYATAGRRAERVMELLLLQMWAERWRV
jgi:asparagine synthase (glutamine-hydrolysing)